jgi:hypothetical protein
MSDHSNLPVVSFNSSPDVFVTELTAVEALGPCVRLVFTVPTQQGTEAFRERIASIVVPHEALNAMVQMLTQRPRTIGKNEPEATFEAEQFDSVRKLRIQ